MNNNSTNNNNNSNEIKTPFEIHFPLRDRKYEKVNFLTHDFSFQYSTLTIGYTTWENRIPQVICWLHGNTSDGHTVAVKYLDWRPYFYLSLSDNDQPSKRIEFIQKYLESNFEDFKKYRGTIEHVMKHPVVGFRNGKKMNFLKFSIANIFAYKTLVDYVLKLYPVPTKSEIENGKYRNEYVVSEHDLKPELKFNVDLGIVPKKWIKLPLGTFRYISGARAMHTLEASTFVLQEIDEIAPQVVVAEDIEQIRFDRKHEMPDPRNEKDWIASIGCSIKATNSDVEYNVILWWGKERKILFPKNNTLNEKTPNVFFFRYENEQEMLQTYILWKRSMFYSPDVTLTWNGYDYDMYQIAYRSTILYKNSMPPGINDWGRIEGSVIRLVIKDVHKKPLTDISNSNNNNNNISKNSVVLPQSSKSLSLANLLKPVQMNQINQTKKPKVVKLSKLENKANSFVRNLVTNVTGMIHIDLLQYYKRDITLKLPRYNLETVAQHFFKEGKDPIHYTQIFDYFFSDTKIGDLLIYNLNDARLVLKCWEHSDLHIRFSNDCSVNCILSDWVLNGQQIRVMGGFYRVARKEDYILYRPYYHPILDGGDSDMRPHFITNDENTMENECTIIDFENRLGARRKYDDMSGLFQYVGSNEIDLLVSKEDSTYSDDETTSIKEIESDSDSDDDDEKSIQKKRKQESSSNFASLFRKTSQQFVEEKKKKQKPKRQTEQDREAAAFSGGFVWKDILPGVYRLVMIQDFNSLYPNIMITNSLDSANIVLESTFANIPGLKYLDIKFNEKECYRVVQGKKGVLLQHTVELLAARKVAQGLMELFDNRLKQFYEMIVQRIVFPLKAKNTDSDHPFLNQDEKTILSKTPREILKFVESFISNQHEDYINFGKTLFDITTDVDVCLASKIDPNFQITKTTKDDIKKTKLHEIQQQKLINILNFVEWRNKNLRDKNFHEILKDFERYLKTQYSNFNQKQLAIKVSANSTYGFCSAGGSHFFEKESQKIKRLGMLPVLPISAMVTFIGRKVILRSVEYVEETYPGSKVIYCDTDSLFITFPENILAHNDEGVKLSFPLAEKIASEITQLFAHEGSTMKIVHEKTATNLILWCAKCYAYLKHEKGKHPKIDIKGVSTSKRDCSKFISNLCNQIITTLIKEGNLEQAFEIVKEHLQNILNEKINKEDFIIYKRVNKVNDVSNQSAHSLLAQKIEERSPGFGPKIGESVSMVYIDRGDYENKLKASEKIEDFDFVISKNLPIDYYWYMKNEFSKKLNLILAPLMKKSKYSNVDDIIQPFAETFRAKKSKIFNMFDKKTLIVN